MTDGKIESTGKILKVSSVVIPQNLNNIIGFGTWKITDRTEMKTALTAAAEAGYMLIDTAAAYSNEISIGKALKDTGADREKIFIQGKLWRTNMGYEDSKEACKKSLHKLKLDYFDSYLIHWPESDDLNAETWTGLQELQQEGLTRYIGVSNFKPSQIKKLPGLPQINQIEIHPGFHDDETINFCRENNIRIQAHSPLGNGRILNNETLKAIAESHGKSTAQICIRWVLDKGADVIVKSSKPERIRENINVFDFSLTDDEMKNIDSLPFCGGLGLDSDKEIDFAKL